MENAGKTAVERVPLSWFVFLCHAGPWHTRVWGEKGTPTPAGGPCADPAALRRLIRHGPRRRFGFEEPHFPSAPFFPWLPLSRRGDKTTGPPLIYMKEVQPVMIDIYALFTSFSIQSPRPESSASTWKVSRLHLDSKRASRLYDMGSAPPPRRSLQSSTISWLR